MYVCMYSFSIPYDAARPLAHILLYLKKMTSYERTVTNMDYRGIYNRLGQSCYLIHMSVAGLCYSPLLPLGPHGESCIVTIFPPCLIYLLVSKSSSNNGTHILHVVICKFCAMSVCMYPLEIESVLFLQLLLLPSGA